MLHVPYKALIFDFYGVICSEIGSPWYKRPASEEYAAELKEKYDKPWNLDLISDDDFFSGIGQAVGLPREQARKEWTDAIVINKPLLAFIRSLKGTYKIAICSNTPRKLFRQILAENDLTSLFDVIVASSEIGKIKPDPEIFRYTLSELDVLPQEAVFIDDREENVKAARTLGITGLVYTDFETLQTALRAALK
jgi:HAD superfamily hydrolase (TIGR01509 family)